MLAFLPAPVTGVIVSTAFVLNLLFWAIPVYVMILIKLVPPCRQQASLAMHWLCDRWVHCNTLLAEGLLDTRWEISGTENLRKDVQYLVVSNHQTYNDIYVLMRAFEGRIPFFKFFIKQELIWVPVLGPVWWALDYPFMKRYSKSQLARNPALRGQDLETARRACAKYKGMPVTVLNFLEGTRFTPAKRDRQRSPYRHLLQPKSGGFAFALAALGDELDCLLDVTIVYPSGAVGFWDFMCGRMRHVIVDVKRREIPPQFFSGEYRQEPEARREFQNWVREMWTEKDQFIEDRTVGATKSEA